VWHGIPIIYIGLQTAVVRFFSQQSVFRGESEGERVYDEFPPTRADEARMCW
jgi:hypothetical protein